MSALTRDEKRLIESHLRRYGEYKELVEQYYASVADGSSSKEEAGKSNAPGKPTEQKVIASLEPPRHIREAERWVRVYELTFERLPACKRELMDRMFRLRQEPAEILGTLAIEHSTFYSWREDIITTFALCAMHEGAMRLRFEDSGRKTAF